MHAKCPSLFIINWSQYVWQQHLHECSCFFISQLAAFLGQIFWNSSRLLLQECSNLKHCAYSWQRPSPKHTCNPDTTPALFSDWGERIQSLAKIHLTQCWGMWSLGSSWDHCAARAQRRNQAKLRINSKLNWSSVTNNSFHSSFPAKAGH